MKTKKGMGVGQVFIFIIAAVTFALIMIFGYKAISGFISSGEEVAFVQFKNDLESSIKKIYTEYDAVRINNYQTPLRYRKICFVNMDAVHNLDDQELCAEDPIACDAWNTYGSYLDAEENVFLQPQAPVKIKVHKISIEGDDNFFLCEDIVRGTFSLQLRGKGDRTELSRVERVEN